MIYNLHVYQVVSNGEGVVVVVVVVVVEEAVHGEEAVHITEAAVRIANQSQREFRAKQLPRWLLVLALSMSAENSPRDLGKRLEVALTLEAWKNTKNTVTIVSF